MKNNFLALVAATISLMLSPKLPADTTNITGVIITKATPRSMVGGKLDFQDTNRVVLNGTSFDVTNISSLKLTTNIVSDLVIQVVPAAQVNPPRTFTGGLADINTSAGQQAVQAVFNTMMAQGNALGGTPKQMGQFGDYFNTTTTALANGSMDLGSIRNQAGQVLEQLKTYNKEMSDDANSATWRQHQKLLEDFVTRYDRGER